MHQLPPAALSVSTFVSQRFGYWLDLLVSITNYIHLHFQENLWSRRPRRPRASHVTFKVGGRHLRQHRWSRFLFPNMKLTVEDSAKASVTDEKRRFSGNAGSDGDTACCPRGKNKQSSLKGTVKFLHFATPPHDHPCFFSEMYGTSQGRLHG